MIPLYKLRKPGSFTKKDYKKTSQRRFPGKIRVQILEARRQNIHPGYREALMLEVPGKQPVLIYSDSSRMRNLIEQLDKNPKRLLDRLVVEEDSTEYTLQRKQPERRTGSLPRAEKFSEKLYNKSQPAGVKTQAEERTEALKQ